MEQAELQYGSSKISLPVVEGSEGERALDISKLRAQTGMITLDPGYVNTGSCESNITFIDGEKGILRYRGYPIEDVCDKTDFIETAYLVIYGRLPDQNEYDKFRDDIAEHSLPHKGLAKMFEAFPKDAHPMALLASVLPSMYAYYPYDENDPEQVDKAILRLLGKVPVLASWVYRKLRGWPLNYSNPDLSYAANFLNLTFSTPSNRFKLDPDIVKALDLLLILHADHEQNCSAASVRMVGSSQVNLYAAIAAGMCSLWGPLHGGANQKVLEMLDMIQRDGGDIDKYLELAKDKESGFRLMGFGHRVYKNFDPRAHIIKKHADRVLSKLGINDPLLNLAKKLEEAALNDPYFAERKLYPNVDFYSGIIYKAMGIPTEMFTVMFAIGRLPGWIAQWREMQRDPSLRIGRPRQVYQGETERELSSRVKNHH
ncbi:citrate synthase [Sulfidibacter corallicola]|uniref:Citrate synthase n=1 Tax=Sulfidibacter corallicola TaxID=2818388 RepID=A0A8A4TFV6_SULCO|nr:citrate synthase [Sulfidibacter corallicola]QTD48072.1 citrate synthase [Sulfidibacter corallicola]